MARRRSADGINPNPWTFKPDRATETALETDLAVLRAQNPRATRSDVIRAWARAGNRQRYLEHQAVLQARLAETLAGLRAAEKAAKAAQDELAGYEARTAKAAAKDVEAALRALRTNPDLVRHVEELARLEAGGLDAQSRYPVLQHARRQLAGWQELLDQRGTKP